MDHDGADGCRGHRDVPAGNLVRSSGGGQPLHGLIGGLLIGLAGLCPGPAIASLALAPLAVLPFVAAMLAGMALHRLLIHS